MGQSQLMLIVLALIIIGTAIAIAIGMFTNSASDANRDAVMADLMTLSQRAQVYYRKPTTLSGGNKSFAGLTADISGLRRIVNTRTNPWKNANGSYSIMTAGTNERVILRGIGEESGQDASLPVAITMEVYQDSVRIVTAGGPTIAN
jgi:Tfp pilus assembly protein PilE